VISEEYSSFI